MNQWDFVLCNFKPDKIFIVGNKEEAMISNPLKTATWISSYEELPDLPLVVTAPIHGRYFKGRIPLSEFEHPKEAIYIFGSDSEVMQDDFKKANYPVYIPTDTTDDMYSFVAYATVAWDRRMKLGHS